MADPVSPHLARNIRQLREARALTQEQCSRISGVPRPTWANLESGGANPTPFGTEVVDLTGLATPGPFRLTP